MFPRARKLTRLIGFGGVIGLIFILYAYVVPESQSFIVSRSWEPIPSRPTQAASPAAVHRTFPFIRIEEHQPNQGSIIKEKEKLDDDLVPSVDLTNKEVFHKYLEHRIYNSSFIQQRLKIIIQEKKLALANSPLILESDAYIPNHSKNILQYESSISTPQNEFSTNRPVINPHNFNYIHNPWNVCSSRSDLVFLIYIHSSPGNLKKRQAIRQTWGSYHLLSHLNATIVFVLGATADQHTQHFIDLEFNKYGDLVQEDFVDTYRNLTYKGMTGLKWASLYCKQISFVLKADDDILLDIPTILEYILHGVVPQHGPNKLVLCNVWHRMKTMRDPNSKWYLSKEEFPHDTFPPYCSGSFYIFSRDIIPDMYRVALNSPFFWVDDYFITGVLINTMKIKHVELNDAYLLNYTLIQNLLTKDEIRYLIFHIRSLALFYEMWTRVLTNRHKGMHQFLDSHHHQHYYNSRQNDSLPFSKRIFKHSNSTL